MRVLHVFQSKDSMKRGYDNFHAEHGFDVVERTAYRVKMRNGEEHRFAVIRGAGDFHKVQGTFWDEISLAEPVTAHTADFLLSLKLPTDDDPLISAET